MPKIILNEGSQKAIRSLIESGLTDSAVIVISPDDINGTLSAEFWNKGSLTYLNTQLLGEVFPGLAVYSFGTERIPAQTVLELLIYLSPDGGHSKNEFCHNDLTKMFKVLVKVVHNA